MVVAVVVATYGRPEGIRTLVADLQALDAPSTPLRELLLCVVSNDDDTATNQVLERDLAALLARPSRTRLRLCFEIEPRRSIPAARNRALRRALAEGAEALAFIDDDESPEPAWLAALLASQAATGAAVVSGPVFPHYETPPPPWVLALGLFDRPPPPHPVAVAYTHNALVSRSLFEELGFFDERFALNGGEDGVFFGEAVRRGHRIAYCEQARVTERIPAERLTRRFVLRRAYRFGNTEGYEAWLHGHGRARALASSTRIVLKACLRLLVSAAAPRARLAALLRLGYGYGMGLGALGLRYDFYAKK
jgi:succinoglycan biosynthesis protein ExoM